MDGLLLVAERDGRRHEIIHDSNVGYYVFRYIGQGPRTTHDYLQDDLEMAKYCAEEEFGVVNLRFLVFFLVFILV